MIALLLLIVLIAATWVWWEGQHWQPDEAVWPDQGALISATDGPVNFRTLKGLGAGFVYLEASGGSDERDARFVDNFAEARAVNLPIGAVHIFDPCVLADQQSANFVIMVPRDAELLPPTIALRDTGENCPRPATRAAIQSELMTLINQIEAHSGKPAILAIGQDFEERYGIASRIERNIWLTQNWFEPVYGGRPWTLWTANETLRTEAADEPLAWVVVRP